MKVYWSVDVFVRFKIFVKTQKDLTISIKILTWFHLLVESFRYAASLCAEKNFFKSTLNWRVRINMWQVESQREATSWNSFKGFFRMILARFFILRFCHWDLSRSFFFLLIFFCCIIMKGSFRLLLALI